MARHGGVRMHSRMSILSLPVIALFVSNLTGCASVGNDFSSEVTWIARDKTTKNELESRLGAPFQVGYDSGQLTWSWGFYRYSLFRPARAKDLLVRFNSNGTVSSYSFSSSFDEDIQNLKNK